MPYDINAALERLEKNLQDLDSARVQVETTVNASNDLQQVVSQYVSSIHALCVQLTAWNEQLKSKESSISGEMDTFLSHMESTSAGIITTFSSNAEKVSNDFKNKSDGTLQQFAEQNEKLTGHVKDLQSLHDSLKKATDEVLTIKNSLGLLSKDLKDSQELQDTVLDDINKKVDEIPVTGKGYKDEIVAKIDSVETKLDTLQSELSQVNTLCQGIKSSSVELNSLMNSSTKALSNTILQSKEDILKSIKTNRLILMAGLIIAGVVALAALRFIL